MMKRKIAALAILLAVFGTIVGWRAAHREAPVPFAEDRVSEEVTGTVNTLIRAVEHGDAAAIKRIWELPDKETAMDCLRKIGRTHDGVFATMSATYDGANRDRVLVTGMMPQGNFAELTLKKQGSSGIFVGKTFRTSI